MQNENSKFKKRILILITIILAFSLLSGLIYSFSQIKNKNTAKDNRTELLANLEKNRQNLVIENNRLGDLRKKSAWNKISIEEYSKVKSLVDKTNIFFKDPNSSKPEIQIYTKNTILKQEINTKRQKINEILKIWNENNKFSLETDKKLIAEVKTYLLIIQSYIEQLQDIVSNLTSSNSSLSTEQITYYTNTLQENSTKLLEITETIITAENVINSDNNIQSSLTVEIEQQIDIITDIQIEINEIEDQLQETIPQPDIVATTTPNQENTEIENTNTAYEEIDWQKYIPTVYQITPTPYRDTGVDISNSGDQPTILQDW